jgi:hypothetical protein
MDPVVRDCLEDLMLAMGRLTTYVFDTPQRLTTVKENMLAVQDHLERVSERLGYAAEQQRADERLAAYVKGDRG